MFLNLNFYNSFNLLKFSCPHLNWFKLYAVLFLLSLPKVFHFFIGTILLIHSICCWCPQYILCSIIIVKNGCHKQIWEQMQLILGKYTTQTVGIEMRKQESILETVCEYSKCCGHHSVCSKERMESISWRYTGNQWKASIAQW